MVWLIGIGLALFLLIILVLVTKLHITIHYNHQHDDDSLVIRFRAWGMLAYTYEVPIIAIDEDSPSIELQQEKGGPSQKKESDKKITKHDILEKIKLFQRLLENIEGFHQILKRFFRHMKVNCFEWHTRFGLGDAAWTGTATGVVWALKGNIVGLTAHYMNLVAEPQLSVEPVWQVEDSETDLVCMISFRIGHAMGAALQIVKFWRGNVFALR
ncbi:MAG TPA: DUF2953 domain-containing protein [Bacillales bacterium]|nr:DUF2953 domain-containing protein [Bacillales bacterium]